MTKLFHEATRKNVNGEEIARRTIEAEHTASDAELVELARKAFDVRRKLEPSDWITFSSGEISIRLFASEIFIGLGLDEDGRA